MTHKLFACVVNKNAPAKLSAALAAFKAGFISLKINAIPAGLVFSAFHITSLSSAVGYVYLVFIFQRVNKVGYFDVLFGNAV